MPQEYQDPIASVIQGLLSGHQVASQIHRQKQEDEAFAQHQALQDQESSIRDIMNRMRLEENARLVTNGAVTLPPLDLPGIAGLPGGQAPGLVRKADSSRTVKYKNSRGEQQDYELFTPEEQQQRANERASATKRAGLIQIDTPPHLVRYFGPTMWSDPNRDVAPLINSFSQSEPFDVPPAAVEELGLPSQLPARNVPQILTAMTGAANRKATDKRAADNRTSAEKRAMDSALSREMVARENRTAANSRSAAANASRERAAGTRRAATGNGEGVQNRFQQRQLENDQKTLRELEEKKDALWAEVEKERSSAPAKDDDKARFEQLRKGRLAGLELRIKGNFDQRQKLIEKWQPKGGMPQPAGGKIFVRLSDGQTGDIDPSDFDPKTMKKLD